MSKVIKQRMRCKNQVKTENGSVLCGIYQIEGNYKMTWLCDECSRDKTNGKL